MLFSTRTLDTALVRLSVNGMKQQNRDNLGTKKFTELQITSTIDSYFLLCVLQKERNLCLLFSYFLFPVAYACDSFIFANGLPSSVAVNEDIVIKDFFVVI